LTLSKQGVGTLVFQQSASSGTVATPLKGTWRLTGVEQTKGSTASGMAATWMTTGVTFDGAGHVLINHRCYVNKGDVVIGRSTLTVSGVTLETAIPCAATRDQRTEQTVNTLLDSVLRGTSTYRVEQRTLSITKGATALTFTKV
jgi:hypothetical protein